MKRRTFLQAALAFSFCGGVQSETAAADAAADITAAGKLTPIARKVFHTRAGNRYRICWTASSTAGTFRVGKSAIRWLPPVLNNPTVIDLNKVAADKKVWTFGATEDVVFLPKSAPWTHDRLQTIGGRNIVLIGGKFVPKYFSSAVGTLNFTRNHGTVYIEGVHVDHAGVGSKDGVGYFHEPGASSGNFIMQNCRVENVKGSLSGAHGDCFQPQGSVKNLGFYNITTTTQYQAFMLEPRNRLGYSIGTITMERVEAAKLPGPDRQSWLYYFTEPGTPIFPITFRDVYVTEAPGLPAESNFVYPRKGMPAGAVRNGNKISWPQQPYGGHITVGRRGFVRPEQCGIGYARDEPVICREGISFVKGANAYEFTAISDKTRFELFRTGSTNVTVTDIVLQDGG